MSQRNNLLIAAILLAVAAPVLPWSAPAALADPLVFDPHQPGHHPGEPAYYHRYRVLAPDWFERRDTITLQVGDAVAANKMIQARDPWPPYVNNRNIQTHGVVMDSAVDRYKAGSVIQPVPLTATLR
jgi:hypothetical protein